MLVRKHKGAKNELVASAWLLDNGYEVFRNLSPFGAIDLIATKGADIFFFDIKTAMRCKNGELVPVRRSKEAIERGVKHLYVLPDGQVFIDWHPVSEELVTINCDKCGNEFTFDRRKRQKHRRFCCKMCAVMFHKTKKGQTEAGLAEAKPASDAVN